MINLVCDKSLHHGHLTRTFSIGPDIVTQALAELGVTQLTPAPDPMADFSPEEALPRSCSRRRLPKPMRGVQRRERAPQALLEQPARTASAGRWHAAEMGRSWSHRAECGTLLVMFSWPNQDADLGCDDAAVAADAKTFLREVAPPQLPANGRSRGAAIGETFEVGVALFVAPARARRLEAELAASGYRASTDPSSWPAGAMYEVRTGPYPTRDDAEVDVARIRQMPGYADARVIPARPPRSSSSAVILSAGRER